jgi:hypothetical protein
VLTANYGDYLRLPGAKMSLFGEFSNHGPASTIFTIPTVTTVHGSLASNRSVSASPPVSAYEVKRIPGKALGTGRWARRPPARLPADECALNQNLEVITQGAPEQTTSASVNPKLGKKRVGNADMVLSVCSLWISHSNMCTPLLPCGPAASLLFPCIDSDGLVQVKLCILLRHGWKENDNVLEGQFLFSTWIGCKCTAWGKRQPAYIPKCRI